MSTASKPRTHSNIFLSGEADPEATAKRQDRLGCILSSGGASSLDTSRSPNPPFSSSLLDGVQQSSNSRRPRIQVVSEATSKSGSSGIDSAAESDDDGDAPPPLSTDIGASPPPSVDGSVSKNQDAAASTSADGPSLMEELMADAARIQKDKEASAKAKERKDAKKASFGMKKGFLDKPKKSKGKKRNKSTTAGTTSSTASATKKRVDESSKGNGDDVFEIDSDGNLVKTTADSSDCSAIPTIRPKKSSPSSEADRLRLEEVQEAMKNSSLEGLVGTSNEWANDDLMQKVANNPRLAAGLRNPKFAAALEAMQRDPKAAMTKFRNHPEIIDFLQEFCGVMGQHFTKLGKEQDQSNGKGKGAASVSKRDLGPLAEAAIKKQAEREARGTAVEPEMSNEEKETLDRIMSDSELTGILMDPAVQRVMQECSLPGRMRMYMQHPEYGPKLRKLLEAGILKMG